MNGAGIAIAQLVAEGVEVVFGIPGEHNIELCNAVLDHRGLAFIVGRHEQSLSFMANGYARLTDRIAVPLVISGPGVTNALTGLADAYADSVPMVLVAACPATPLRGKGAFHELKDQSAALASVTKWQARVDRADAVPAAIRRAFAEARAGRPGPTAVEIPVDVQVQVATTAVVPPVAAPPPAADPGAVAEAARRLQDSARPMVLIGGGAARSACGCELRWLVEHLDAPFFHTALGKGVVPDDHPLGLGWLLVHQGAGRKMLESASTLLVVGSSLDELDTDRWRLPLPADLIQIDTCPQVLGRNYPVSVGLAGDARTVLGQLRAALSQRQARPRGTAAAEIAAIKARMLAGLRDRPAWQLMQAIGAALPPDGVVTNDASIVNGWVLAHLARGEGRTCFITRALGALGYALPAAVGAKVADRGRAVVAVVGDGGFLFSAEVLATAVQHELNVVAVVFNDHAYSSIRRSQQGRFGRTIGVDLVNPDFVKLAESFGAAAERVETPSELRRALLDGFARRMPTVLEVPWEGDLDMA